MSIQDIRLPDRPIKVDPRAITRPAGTMLSVVIVGGLLAFLAIWQIPSLWRDMQIRNAPVIVQDGDVQDGQCSSRQVIFVDCSAHVVYDYKGRHYESDVELFFVDFHTGDYTVDLVISDEKPELATISIGLEKFWNRIVLLGAFLVILGGLVVTGIVAASRMARARRQLAVPGRLSLVTVDVAPNGTAWGRNQFSYNLPASKTVHATLFAKGTAPLLATDAAGVAHGYAVMHENAKVPVLLDSGLNRIDLTAGERSQMLGVIAGAAAAAAPPPPVQKRGMLAGLFRTLRRAFLITALIVTGVVGYWVYYAVFGTTAFDQFGMEINNLMPDAMNVWACGKLELRFGDQNAPYGCTAGDYVSWK